MSIPKLESKLTPSQKKAKGWVEWLLDYNKALRSGRTYLMAVVFIEKSMKDGKVKVFDHYPYQTGQANIMRQVYFILNDQSEEFKSFWVWRMGNDVLYIYPRGSYEGMKLLDGENIP